MSLCIPVDCSPPGSYVHGDSPGKNTRVGSLSLLQGIFLIHNSIVVLVTQSCPTLCNSMDCSQPGSSVHGDSPGKNTGVGCHAHLLGIFPTQGSKPGLPHCRWILYHLSHTFFTISDTCRRDFLKFQSTNLNFLNFELLYFFKFVLIFLTPKTFCIGV